MCMEENLRPVSLCGGKTVSLFQAPLHGEALDPRAGSDCLLSHLPTSPHCTRFPGVPVLGEEPMAGYAPSAGPWPCFHPVTCFGASREGYRPSLPLACFPNPPLRPPLTVLLTLQTRALLSPPLRPGRASSTRAGHPNEPCPLTCWPGHLISRGCVHPQLWGRPGNSIEKSPL